MEATAEVIPGLTPFAEYAPEYLRIIDKDGDLVPFRLNRAQLRLDRAIERARSDGRPVRIIILKARQLGFSTYSLGRMYEFCTTREGCRGFLAAHDDGSTRDLFDKVRLMYDMAPDPRPMTRYSSKTELDFSNPNRAAARVEPGLLSHIGLGTAGKTTLGRGKTLRYLHCSEVAFWDRAKTVLVSLEQTVPKNPDTVQIIESTANGVGGEFYDRWQRTQNERTRGDWRGIFFAWFLDPKYRVPLSGGEMLPIPSCVQDTKEFLEGELEIKGLNELDDEQLNWRRWAIVNLCGNDLDIFCQEYPSSPEEAFIATGKPVFNVHKIHHRLRQLEAEDLRRQGEHRPRRFKTGKVRRSTGKVIWTVSPGADLRVYEWPKRNHQYVIGADVAEGVTLGDKTDESALHVIDRHSWVQVAVFSGKLPVHDFAELLLVLGYWYNRALIAPEVNNHGHSVCQYLEIKRYPRLYLRQKLEEVGSRPVTKIGWETNKKTRPMLVDAVDTGINDALLVLHDVATLRQLLTFVRDPKSGKPQGDAACLDDLVMALGITTAVMEWGSVAKKPSSKLDLDTLAPQQRMVSRMIKREKFHWKERQKLKGR